jgi:phosphoribosylglycinamide formyltransferase-1
MRIVALASHGGSIVQTVVQACHRNALDAAVVLVISNNSDSKAIERAAATGIKTKHLSNTTHSTAEALDTALCDALVKADADCVLLGGYMKKLGPKVLSRFSGRIVNTHPSLLPKYGGQGFYGRKVHEAVIAAGDDASGATVHLVEEDYDTGPILAQVKISVSSNDTVVSVERRVRAAERRLIVAALKHLSEKLAPTAILKAS